MSRVTVLATFFLLVFSFGCIAADGPGSSDSTGPPALGSGADETGQIDMRVVKRGTYGKMAEEIDSGRRRAPFIEVARDGDELAALWHRYIEDGEVPDVSFDESMVVFLLMPPQPTGGYGVEPKGVSVSDGTVRVDATLHQPGQDDVVTQAFTAPYAVVDVEKAGEVGTVVWINQGRPLATKRIER